MSYYDPTGYSKCDVSSGSGNNLHPWGNTSSPSIEWLISQVNNKDKAEIGFPLDGKITVNAGFPKYPSGGPHSGIDFNVNMNQEVHAVTDGSVYYNVKVMYINKKYYYISYGKYAVQNFEINDNKYDVYYAHMNKLPSDIENQFNEDFKSWSKGISDNEVSTSSIIDSSYGLSKEGAIIKTFTYINDNVSKKDVIGHAGNTGNSTGKHLHFEVKKDGAAINPTTVVKGLPNK